MRKRSRNLELKDLDLIVGLLDGWSGPLSWGKLIDAVELRLYFRYTRQALASHKKVGDAFKLCKARLLGRGSEQKGRKPPSPIEAALKGRLERREAEVTRLKAENQQLMEKFVVWLYNSQTRGLTLADLERPLPSVNRGQTKVGLRAVPAVARPSKPS